MSKDYLVLPLHALFSQYFVCVQEVICEEITHVIHVDAKPFDFYLSDFHNKFSEDETW